MAKISCILSLVHIRRHCVDGLLFTCILVGPKIDCGSKKLSDSDDELDLTRIDEQVRAQQGLILTQLSDSLLETPMCSTGIVGETERLEDLTLGSDEEREINSISVSGKTQEAGPTTSVSTKSQSSSENDADKTLVRQDAVGSDEETTAPVGRTKKEKASWGVRKAVEYLNKVATRDPATHDGRDKLAIKRHRKNIHKFERTYGSIANVLGLAYPEGFRGKVDVTQTNANQGEESSSTLEAKVDGKEEAQSSKDCAPSIVATKGDGSTPVKPGGGNQSTARVVKEAIIAPQPKGDEERTASSKASTSKDPQKGKLRGDLTGKKQNSKTPNVDHHHTGNSKGKSVTKRARSGDDQQKPKAKKVNQITMGSRTDSKKVSKRVQTGDDKPSTSKKVKVTSQSGVIQAAVIDRKDPDGRITSEMWRLLEDRLMDEIFQARHRPQEIAFMGADWAKGVKTVGCGNKETFEFLKAAINRSSNLCPSAQLDVILASELPLRPIVTVWIPPPIKPVEVILGILEGQNVGLPASKWKFVSKAEGEETQGRDFRFAVDQESLARLDSVGGVVTFGLGYLKFRYPKLEKAKEAADGADKSASL